MPFLDPPPPQTDIDRVQKAALRLILGEKYENYEDGLFRANL